MKKPIARLQKCLWLMLSCAILFPSEIEATRFPWAKLGQNPDDWHRSAEGKQVAAHVLSHQSPAGSWPKNIDTSAGFFEGDRANLRGTFDNSATFGEMRFLARAYQATGEKKLREAFVKALDHILEAQYPTGGWPQYHPPGSSYPRHITLNDGVMVHILELLREIAGSEVYQFLDSHRLDSVRQAFDRGIDCLLEAQIEVEGVLTAWCQQHDPETLEPRGGRSYEHPSITGGESARVLLFLMGLDNPGPGVIRAIEAGVGWYERVQLRGLRVERRDGDRVVFEDASAPPIWARFYEIGSNRPIFSGRDGVIRYQLSEIERERRAGYAWYGDWGRPVLERYGAWKERHRRRGPVLSIEGERFLLDGKPCEMWGIRVASATMNDASSRHLIDQLDEYKAHGVNTVAVFYSGSSAGYYDPFSPDGKQIDPGHQTRMKQIIEACAERDMVVIVGIFYQRVDYQLADAQAIVEAVRAVTRALEPYGNVIINIANEQNSPRYRGKLTEILRSPETIIDLCRVVKEVDANRLAGGGGYDHSHNEEIGRSEEVDVLLFDTAGIAPGSRELYRRFRQAGVTNKPIVNVETFGGWTRQFPPGVFPPEVREAYQREVAAAAAEPGLSVFFHNNPWLQGPSMGAPLRFDLGREGTEDAPGIRWYFESVRQARQMAGGPD